MWKQWKLISPDAFWKRVVKSDAEDECWSWTGSTSKGYGRIRYPGPGNESNWIYAHIYSFLLHGGKLEDGQLVRHTCDNPICSNPRHLIAGTHLDNHRDAMARGRHAFGDRSGQAKINNRKARLVIECLLKKEPRKSISRRLRVSIDTVHRIARKEHWKHVWREVEGNHVAVLG